MTAQDRNADHKPKQTPRGEDLPPDPIFASFLEYQWEEGQALAAESSTLELYPVAGGGWQSLVARFTCRGLIRLPDGSKAEAERFDVGIRFPDDYLRRANAFQVLTWHGPREVFHPNIDPRKKVLCIGPLAAATPLVSLLYRCHDLITYRKLTVREDDALNAEACQWARGRLSLFPVDERPLRDLQAVVPAKDRASTQATVPAKGCSSKQAAVPAKDRSCKNEGGSP